MKSFVSSPSKTKECTMRMEFTPAVKYSRTENGSQARAGRVLSCMPSIRTTARTGPLCSTVTLSMRLRYSSSVNVWLAASAERSSRMATRCPARPTSLPSMVRDSMRFAPPRATRQRSGPVEISIEVSSSRTTTGFAGATGDPGPAVRGAVSFSSAATAMPDHFTEPSGQYARGHVWVGIGLPSAFRTTNSLPLDTVPRGHGTPQLTPAGAAGAWSPSQCRAAAGAGGAF